MEKITEKLIDRFNRGSIHVDEAIKIAFREGNEPFEKWKSFITELFIDYGMSVVESDRLFESGKSFVSCLKDLLDKENKEARTDEREKTLNEFMKFAHEEFGTEKTKKEFTEAMKPHFKKFEESVRKDEQQKFLHLLSTQTLELMGDLPLEFAIEQHDKAIRGEKIE